MPNFKGDDKFKNKNGTGNGTKTLTLYATLYKYLLVKFCWEWVIVEDPNVCFDTHFTKFSGSVFILSTGF